MISLELSNKKFSKNDKWPLLFVIAEIIIEESNSTNTINNLKIVEVAKEKYNLKVERRTVAQYKKYLEQYFGFVFKNKGRGYYISKMPLPYHNEHQIDGIEHFDSDDFETIHERVLFCNKAIKNEKYIYYWCPEYVLKSLKIVRRRIKLIPIRVICFGNKYFLFSYAVPFNDYFYVNLETSIFDKEQIYESFSRFGRKSELFNYKEYFKVNADIVTGRKDILNKIIIESPQYEFGNEDCYFYIYKNKQFYPESIVALKEKHGGDEIYELENNSNYICLRVPDIND